MDSLNFTFVCVCDFILHVYVISALPHKEKKKKGCITVVAKETRAPYRNIETSSHIECDIFYFSSQLQLKMYLTKNQALLVVAFLCAIVCSYVQCGKCEI